MFKNIYFYIQNEASGAVPKVSKIWNFLVLKVSKAASYFEET